MADEVKIVVIDGVRYRAEDAPKGAEKASDPKVDDEAQHKMRRVSRKSE